MSEAAQAERLQFPLRILVLCTRNSARSQIAEALFARLGGDRVVVASAGSDPGPGVHPLAVAALAESGIDWYGGRSQGIEAVINDPWDAVITVCDAARDACPFMPTAGVAAHWGMEDPAAVTGNHEVQRNAFRRTRERLREAVQAFLDTVDRIPAQDDARTLRDALDNGRVFLERSASTALTNVTD